MVIHLEEMKKIKRETKKTVTILIPALNEDVSIGKTIRDIPKAELIKKGYEVKVLVIDNGSTDSTREIAEEAGADVVSEPNRGKGNAVKTGLKHIKSGYIVMLDADYTYPPSYIPRILELLKNSDVVIGSRLNGDIEQGAMSKSHYVGNHVLSKFASVLYHKNISDLTTGYWGYRAEVMKSLDLKATGFELEAEMFSQIARKGYSLTELPIRYIPRNNNAAKLNAIRDGLRVCKILLSRRFSCCT
jgi:glycosyltransferase involved in cell wall biosynthesis